MKMNTDTILSFNKTQDNWFDRVSKEMNRYLPLIIFIFGVIGNILNIFVLSQRNLRSNACGWLFLMASIANLISILFGLITRILLGWTTDPTETISWICKLRTFTVFSSRTIGFWLLAFATIDRWLLSSTEANRRKRSTLKNAYYRRIIIVIMSICLYAQMVVCYEANLIGTPLKCYSKNLACRYSTDLVYALVTILSPLSVMFLFGLLTILNIQQSHQRTRRVIHDRLIHNLTLSSTDTTLRQQQKKTDRYLLFMLFSQTILLALFTIPQAIYRIYSTVIDQNVLLTRSSLESFIYNFVLLLSFIANGMPFYIYTLCGGKLFRKALFDLLRTIRRKCLCQSQS